MYVICFQGETKACHQQVSTAIKLPYKFIMELTINGAVVSDAIKYVIQKQEEITTLQKLDE
jgi:hypothetical protein